MLVVLAWTAVSYQLLVASWVPYVGCKVDTPPRHLSSMCAHHGALVRHARGRTRASAVVWRNIGTVGRHVSIRYVC